MKKRAFLKTLPLITVTLLMITFGAGCAYRDVIRVGSMPINEVDLWRIHDGSYRGDFSYARFTYEVEVTVKQHEITKIEIVKNRDTKYAKKAERVVERVLQTQSPKVDAISGATTTSKALLKAIENALSSSLSTY